MKRKAVLKMKRAVLKTSVWVAGIAFMFSICMVDSESWIPVIVCYLSLGWLMLMAWANGYFD
jgi:hypothetical protein